jgi:hypothetical protein
MRSGLQNSHHTNPLRPVHANCARRASSQIKRNSPCKWAAVVDRYSNGSAILRIGNRHLRSEWKRAMRGRIPPAIKPLTARRSPSRSIVGRNDMLSRTVSVRPRVREKPSETLTVRLSGRRDQRCRSQSNNKKRWTHWSFHSFSDAQ